MSYGCAFTLRGSGARVSLCGHADMGYDCALLSVVLVLACLWMLSLSLVRCSCFFLSLRRCRCVVMTCGGRSFSPDAYDSAWDSVLPMKGEYTINYFQYQGVCMLYDWLCSNDEFCADNYNFQFKLKGKGRSVKWEVFLYGGMSINVDRDRAEVLPKGVLPASLCKRQVPEMVQTVQKPAVGAALGQGCGHARRCATTVAGLDVQKAADFSAVSVHYEV